MISTNPSELSYISISYVKGKMRSFYLSSNYDREYPINLATIALFSNFSKKTRAKLGIS